MVALILDPLLEDGLIADRRAGGLDRYDEVWDGVYVMSPLANDEHQDLATGIATVLRITIQWTGLGQVRQGINVSDRREDWKQNYRCPDVAVFLNDSPAANCDTFWLGGPDVAVEIVSPHDRSREKFHFYASVGTRELLIVDRYPWALELYRLQERELRLVGRRTAGELGMLASEVLPLSWRLVDGPRPQIEVVHADGGQRWLV